MDTLGCGAIIILALCCLLTLWFYCRRPLPPILFGSELQLSQRAHTGSVIHLDARTDREQNVRQLLDAARSAGVHLQVFSAVDGRSCDELTVSPFWDYSDPPGHVRTILRGGEQGCLSSFLRLFAMPMTEVGRFFLEDDAVMSAEGFRNMGRLLSSHSNEPLAFHGMRAYARGQTAIPEVRAQEAASEGRIERGWCDVRVPNYSNALFAVTAVGLSALKGWTSLLEAADLHKLPADDLLSAAGNAYPGKSKPPMDRHWRAFPKGPLQILAPRRGNEQSSRMDSASDTERRVPLRESGKHCATLLCPNRD